MKAKYVRKKRAIMEIETRKVTTYESLNRAKKASREIQQREGVLGGGVLIVL